MAKIFSSKLKIKFTLSYTLAFYACPATEISVCNQQLARTSGLKGAERHNDGWPIRKQCLLSRISVHVSRKQKQRTLVSLLSWRRRLIVLMYFLMELLTCVCCYQMDNNDRNLTYRIFFLGVQRSCFKAIWAKHH